MKFLEIRQGIVCSLFLILSLGASRETRPADDGFALRSLMPPGAQHAALRRAVMGARQHSARPECLQLFSELEDASGRTLQERLDTEEWTAASYLGLIVFADGARLPQCRDSNVFAVSAAGVVAQPADAVLSRSTETIAEVPFELYQHHLIVTRGSIGRLDGLSLLIDTGSIPSMVDARIARKLDLQAESSVLVAFGQSVTIRSAVLDGFRMGSMRSGPVPTGVSDLSYLEGVRIDAIVGLDVLARTSFSIDYRTRVLRFAPTGREDWVAPLELVWPFLTVRMTIAGQQVRLLVDTGSSDLVVFKTRLPAALSGARWRGEKNVQYASGVARLQRLDLGQVSLGEHVWDKLEGWTLDRVPHGYPTGIDGVLGVRSLGCTRVRFDFERNELGCSR
jgi:hypothetical protein